LRYIHPDFIKSVADKDGKLVAFAITMPSFSRALKKMNGKLFPFGFLRILKSQIFNNRASLYLIGVHPDYQNKGVTAILFNDLQTMFNKRGIKEVETNPELIENNSIQAFWKNYESVLHKKRSTFTKEI
jgi:ribosomal protein S18 acetylase RimI-like enzyme